MKPKNDKTHNLVVFGPQLGVLGKKCYFDVIITGAIKCTIGERTMILTQYKM
jgi:hypothetical protein